MGINDKITKEEMNELLEYQYIMKEKKPENPMVRENARNGYKLIDDNYAGVGLVMYNEKTGNVIHYKYVEGGIDREVAWGRTNTFSKLLKVMDYIIE